MGKYMRKAKGGTGEVAVMEVQSSLGVRTRAKTLALQRIQAAAAAAAAVAEEDGSYLQLRSRRLHKLSAASLVGNVRRRKKKKGNSGAAKIEKDVEENFENKEGIYGNSVANGGGEKVVEDVDDGCFGENILEIEGRERTTRESTPCNLIANPDDIRTPGSSTKPPRVCETGSRVQISVSRGIPTTQEMNELFGPTEEQQRKRFIEKYNFDPANDKPLPGRFKWEKLDP